MVDQATSELDRLIAGVDTVYPTREQLAARLSNGEPLRLYLGIDPTNPILHLGHTVPLRLLKRFQEAGHRVVLLVGDFTATVGDPSGRDIQRAVLTRESVEANVLAIKEQVFKVLDSNKTELRFNSEWYDDPAQMGSVRKLLELTHSFTAAQLWERDMFQVRQQKQQPVSVTEFLYPVLQAYDSVALDVDIEVGGTDQTFNMLAGRTLLKQKLGKEKFVITLPLILGTDGRKMSKSFGNTIGVMDEPNDMFGKLMAVNDELIVDYMIHLTDRFQDESERREFEQLAAANPRDAKAAMAREIVMLYHGSEAGSRAESAFNAQFRDKEVPIDLLPVRVQSVADISDLLVQIEGTSSRSEAVRLVEQGGVSIDDQRIDDPKMPIPYQPGEPFLLRVGKRRLFKIIIAE